MLKAAFQWLSGGKVTAVLILAAFVAGFSLAAYWRGLVHENLRYQDQISQSDALLAAYADNDVLTAELVESSRNHYQAMKEKLRENADLATAIAAGRLRLHLAESVTEACASGGVADGTTCGINALGGQVVHELKAGIIFNKSQAIALQERNRILEDKLNAR